MNSLPKYQSQFSDRHNYVFGSVTYINEIHLILDFEGKIDQKRMRKALRLLLNAEPLLGCRFVKHWLKPYWTRLPGHELDSVTSFGFTNLGVIDIDTSSFDSIRLLSAEMTCPGSKPPMFLCALSGFNETLTLNAGIFESSIPKEAIEELFDLVGQELPD